MGRRINKNERKGNGKNEKSSSCKPWDCTHTHTHTSDLINKKAIINTNKKIVTKA